MQDATERARPAMAYIRELEQRVRDYQNETRRNDMKWFAFGLFVGAAAITFIRLLAGNF